MASDTVKARWAAGFHALLADGREIAPGDEVEVGRDEAEASDNWDTRGKTLPRGEDVVKNLSTGDGE